MKPVSSSLIALSLAATVCSLVACGQPEQPNANNNEQVAESLAPAVASSSATIAQNPLKEAYFGEQHIHTAYSLDAYIGGTRLTPLMPTVQLVEKKSRSMELSISSIVRWTGSP